MDLVGCSFLLDADDGEDTLRTQIVEAIQDHDKSTKGNPVLSNTILSTIIRVQNTCIVNIIIYRTG